MLELRVEATLATVFAAVSFLVAALGCCSSRHHGRRAIAALITMFLSGAIMMVPVVHMIIHHNMAAHNHVNKPKLASNYMPHDLAGHYSIIVTGIGSLIAVLAAVVITVVKCRSPSELSNEYNLDRKSRETDGRKEKHELPIHWIRNTNIALPPVTASTMDELHGDDSESGYSDLKDEDSASGSHEPNGQAETA
ncbi:hypothetical protein MAR_027396 [Mya arenaria]|uniref:Uncharacterized protein n=1 Tax=Mya arenaria TaxID=6604 RepID=A0ABY7EWL4_MYAAR|nr:hypothetical protein MAR_027396 [Mya arenaria]